MLCTDVSAGNWKKQHLLWSGFVFPPWFQLETIAYEQRVACILKSPTESAFLWTLFQDFLGWLADFTDSCYPLQGES